MACALAAGVLVPLQAGINTSLAQRTGSSLSAALISFSVGTLALVLTLVFSRTHWPKVGVFGEIPPGLWLGGLCGAILVWASIICAPKLGAATLISLIIAGQLTASLVFDHFGWLGFPVHELSSGRVLGLVLLATGILLIKKF